MTKSKKGIVIAIAAVVVVLAVVLVVVLTLPKTRVSSITVSRNEMPRLTYVQGQELDLSEGILTVSYTDGSTEALSLDAEGVEISGYDPQKTGSQTVTVRYGEQVFEFEVTVIDRIRVESPQTVYYQGENLDVSRGRLVIARDDATTFNVLFSDEGVSFLGFDSSEPATDQEVTVRYQSGETDVQTSFQVNIYTTENAELTPPRKTDYKSHESLQVNGAYITYSNGDPAYDKNIPVTEEMISGLDFSKVTPENSPMTQTAVVTFGGREYPFSVTITYSEVSALQALLNEYNFTWTDDPIPEVTEEEGSKALECLDLYLALSGTERSYIEDILTVVRIAAVYTNGQWQKALSDYEDCFFITDEIRYTLTSYAAAAAAQAVIADPESEINVLADSIENRFLSNFPAQEIGGKRFDEYLDSVNVYREGRGELADLLEYFTRLYETLEPVPSDAADLTAYAGQFDQALAVIEERADKLSAYRQVLAQVSTWREQDDFYDLLYAYFLQVDDQEAIASLKEIILPADLEKLYDNLIQSLTQYLAIYEGDTTGRSSDSTLMVYYYRLAQKLAEQIEATGEGMIYDLYRDLTFENLFYNTETNEPIPTSYRDLFVYLESSPYGYFELLSGVLDDPDLNALWDSYLALLDIAEENDLLLALRTFLEEMFDLRPGQLKSFLYSINVYYAGYELPALDTENAYSILTRMLTDTFKGVLNEEEFSMFRNLLLAMEHYASLSERETATQDFLTALGEVTATYQAASDKTDFDTYFGAGYQKYLGFAALYNADGTLKQEFNLSEEWQVTLQNLTAQIQNMFYAASLITPAEGEEGTEIQPQNAYIRLFASYESARQLLRQILDEAPAEVLQAYIAQPVTFGDLQMTLDYVMSVEAINLGVLYYTSLRLTYDDGTTGSTIFEVISEYPALRDFMAQAEPVVWTEGEALISAEAASGIMGSFLELSNDEKQVFTILQSFQEGKAYYYDGLKTIFDAAFAESQALQEATAALLEAEQAMVAYQNLILSESTADSTEEQQEAIQAALTAVQEAMASLETALSALSETELTEYNGFFAEIVTYYREAFAAIQA